MAVINIPSPSAITANSAFISPFLSATPIVRGNRVSICGATCDISSTSFITHRVNFTIHRPRTHQFSTVIKAQDSQDEPFDVNRVKDAIVTQVKGIPSRPVFYGSIAFASVALLVTLKISSSLISSLDSFPLIPDTLRLIGLGYSCWFVWKYLIFSESREQFLDKFAEIFNRIKWE